MNTSEFSEQQLLLAGYVLGDLDVEESYALEQLLSNDPALRQELAALQRSLDTAYGLEIAPPPALKSSVLAAAEQAMRSPIKSQPARSQTARPQTARPQSILLLVTGVLTALSLYLGLQNYSLRQALRDADRDAGLEQVADGPADGATELVTYSLDPTENATQNEQTSSVELSIDRDRLEAVLAAEGLPVLSENQVYALWTVIPADAPVTKDDKNAILTAVFTVDQAGRQTQEIVLPAVFRDRIPVEAVAITVEDAEAPQAHESSPILFHRL